MSLFPFLHCTALTRIVTHKEFARNTPEVGLETLFWLDLLILSQAVYVLPVPMCG